MLGTSLIDHSRSDGLNPLSRSMPTVTSTYHDHRQNLREKLEQSNQDDDPAAFLDTLESIRLEQRVRLAQVEHDYYNQKNGVSSGRSSASIDGEEVHRKERMITSKPPLPTASKRSASPEFLTEERAQYHLHRRPVPMNIVRRHDEEIAFCPHRTWTGKPNGTVHDLTTNHVRNQIQTMWNEFDLDDSSKQYRFEATGGTRRPSVPTAASWAGRTTIPEPFSLTNSTNFDSVHRRKCMHDIEVAKLQKEVDEELHCRPLFKGNHPPWGQELSGA